MATFTCPHCGQPHPEGAQFCPITGKPITEVIMPTARACPKCGKATQPDWLVCPYCNESLEEKILKCQKCGKRVEVGWVTCPYCKQALADQNDAEVDGVAPSPSRKWRSPILFTLIVIVSVGGILLATNVNGSWLAAQLAPALISTFTPRPPTSTPTPVPTPTPVMGSTQVSKVDGMTLMYVPEGSFTMGGDNGGSDEKPVHTVTLNAFWIDKTEATNAMYALCVKAGACSAPNQTRSYTHSNYYGNTQYNNYPVIYVSWNDATKYCGWAERRLPTEAEWEKAARGTDGRTYPWGNAAPDQNKLNYFNNVGDTTEVGKYPSGASFYGAMDMAGNVWEWVNDWYDENYYKNSPSQNPKGASSGQYRVLRGGAWGSNDLGSRASVRNGNDPSGVSYFIGFRCASSP